MTMNFTQSINRSYNNPGMNLEQATINFKSVSYLLKANFRSLMSMTLACKTVFQNAQQVQQYYGLQQSLQQQIQQIITYLQNLLPNLTVTQHNVSTVISELQTLVTDAQDIFYVFSLTVLQLSDKNLCTQIITNRNNDLQKIISENVLQDNNDLIANQNSIIQQQYEEIVQLKQKISEMEKEIIIQTQLNEQSDVKQNNTEQLQQQIELKNNEINLLKQQLFMTQQQVQQLTQEKTNLQAQIKEQQTDNSEQIKIQVEKNKNLELQCQSIRQQTKQQYQLFLQQLLIQLEMIFNCESTYKDDSLEEQILSVVKQYKALLNDKTKSDQIQKLKSIESILQEYNINSVEDLQNQLQLMGQIDKQMDIMYKNNQEIIQCLNDQK